MIEIHERFYNHVGNFNRDYLVKFPNGHEYILTPARVARLKKMLVRVAGHLWTTRPAGKLLKVC